MGLIILCKLKNIQNVVTLYSINVSLLHTNIHTYIYVYHWQRVSWIQGMQSQIIFCQKYFDETKLFIFIYI